MYAFRLRAAAVALVAGFGLTGCMSPYGSGVSVGVGNGGYYDPYYGGYGTGGGYPAYGYGAGYGYGSGYPGYGYGAGYPGYGYGYAPWGWYDNFYYPGTGYYVYDSYRRPHRWTDAQRRYWESRRSRGLTVDAFRKAIEAKQQNWAEFEAGPIAATQQQVPTRDGQRVRVERPRTDRIERANRTERIQRTDRAQRIERDNRVERANRPDRVEPANRAERVEPANRAERVEPANRAERVERTRPVRAERSERQSSRELRSSMSNRTRAERGSGNDESED